MPNSCEWTGSGEEAYKEGLLLLKEICRRRDVLREKLEKDEKGRRLFLLSVNLSFNQRLWKSKKVQH